MHLSPELLRGSFPFNRQLLESYLIQANLQILNVLKKSNTPISLLRLPRAYIVPHSLRLSLHHPGCLRVQYSIFE